MVKEENRDLLADSHSILNRWKNYFCQLLNEYGVKDVRQTEIRTAEPLVPEPSSFEVEIAFEKLKSNGDRASPCFRPFLIGNAPDKYLPV
jgi:hypothetical protein